MTEPTGAAAAPIVRAYGELVPRLHPSVWLAPGCAVVGDVSIGEDSTVWYGAVLRGDVHAVSVGARSNVQDAAVLHVTKDRFPCRVGDEVTIGHRAVVHGCRVGDRAMIGIGAIVLDGAEVGEEAWVAAGAVVVPGARIPPRMLAIGTPARAVRELGEEERAVQLERTLFYVETARRHASSRSLADADLASPLRAAEGGA